MKNEDYIIVGSDRPHAAIKTNGVCSTLTAHMGKGGGVSIPWIIKKNNSLEISDMTKDSESEKMTIPPQYNAERAADIQTEYLSSLLQQMKRGGVLTEDGTLFPMISKNDRLRKTLEKMNAERSPQYIDAYNQQTNENAQTITSRVDATGNTALYDGFLIRKLTPKECWRLMGFDDSDYEKAAAVNAKSQLYKQAGNSIVVNVLEAIFKNLFFDEKDEGYRQSDIWDFL